MNGESIIDSYLEWLEQAELAEEIEQNKDTNESEVKNV